jgi:hypothetical protein
VSGGKVTVNGGDNTLYDVAAGSGIVVDPVTGAATTVTWGALTAQGTKPYGGDESSVAIDAAGAVHQYDGLPTPAKTRDYIQLAVLHHPSAASDVVDSVCNTPVVVHQVCNQLHDSMRAIGMLCTSGNVLSAAEDPSTTLNVVKSAGTVYAYGANFQTPAVRNPHSLTTAAIDTSGAGTFSYRLQDNTVDNATAGALDPNNYDNGGTKTAVGSNNWTTQRVYLMANGMMIVQYGQSVHSRAATAIGEARTEDFVVPDFIANHTCLIGLITVKAGAANLADAIFSPVSKFEPVSAPSSVTTLQSAYNNSGTDPSLTTTTAAGPLTLVQGSAEGTAVLAVEDDADTAVFEVHGTEGLVLPVEKTVASSSAAGRKGQIAWDADFIYVCTATDTWKRAALATW